MVVGTTTVRIIPDTGKGALGTWRIHVILPGHRAWEKKGNLTLEANRGVLGGIRVGV